MFIHPFRPARLLTSLILLLAAWWPASAPAETPDPQLAKYIVRNEKLSAAPETFNYATTRTRTVNLGGKVLLFDGASPKNTLMADFQNRHDIRQINLYAEQVLIRGQLRLPASEVNIYAYELRFEDPAGAAEPSSISTTPYILTTRPAMQHDSTTEADTAGQAANGLKAGDMNLAIANLAAPAFNGAGVVRFILRGGDGQPAGLGRDGVAGASMKVYDSKKNPLPITNIPAGTVRIYDQNAGITMWEGGSTDWPGDGEAAISAGSQGLGGNGGLLHSTLGMDYFLYDLAGGVPGRKGLDTYGGQPGQPITSRCVYVGTPWGTNTYQILSTETHTSVKGADAVAPEVLLGDGQTGDFSTGGSIGSWFHPFLLKSIQLYAQDLMATDKALAHQMVYSYLGAYNAYKLTDPWYVMSAEEKAGYEATAQAMWALYAATQNAAQGWAQYQ